MNRKSHPCVRFALLAGLWCIFTPGLLYATDCNINGRDDALDIAGPTSEDCNTNQVPDECDVMTSFAYTSATYSPFGFDGVDRSANFTIFPPLAADSVTIEATTRAKFNAGFENWVEVYVDDTHVGDILQDAIECWPSTDALTLTAADFNAFAQDGVVSISLRASRQVWPYDCASFIRARVFYDLAPLDCNSNGLVDSCEPGDCNHDGASDIANICDGASADCNHNWTPDECEPSDCNTNGIPDVGDLCAGSSPDCNTNLVPDECDIQTGDARDCDRNGIPDECDPDCNTNDVPDACDLASSGSPDCNTNSRPDECDVLTNPGDDCDRSGVPDECEMAERDCNHNGVLDVCGSDRYYEATSGRLAPFDAAHPQTYTFSMVPLAAGDVSLTFVALSDITWDYTFIQLDLNDEIYDKIPMSYTACWQQGAGTMTVPAAVWNRAAALDGGNVTLLMLPSTVVGECLDSFIKVDVNYPIYADCDQDDVLDVCQSLPDCNGDGIVDLCRLNEEDCNSNHVLDACDLTGGASLDCDSNGIPDECASNWQFHDDSGQLSPLDGEHPQSHTLHDVPIAAGPVTLSFSGAAALTSPGSAIRADLNGTPLGGVLSRFGRCATIRNTITILPEQWNSIIANGGGDVRVNLTPDSNVGGCPHSFGQVVVSYVQSDCNGNGAPDRCDLALTGLDCNSNGRLDECEPDCDGNHVPDDCDLASGSTQDCNANGVSDACDLLARSATHADACAAAQLVLPNTLYTASTLGATYDGVATCASGASNIQDIWYAYRPLVSGELTVSLCGSTVGTNMSVHTACPALPANQVACELTNCGIGSIARFGVSPGTNYYIRIAAAPQGTIQTYLTSPAGAGADCNNNLIPDECEINAGSVADCNQNLLPDACELQSTPMPHDQCPLAPLITSGVEYRSALGPATDSSIPFSCESSGHDQWFKYIPQSNGLLTIAHCGTGFGTVLSMYPACPTFHTELFCSLDSCGRPPSLNVVAGVSYWLRIGGHFGKRGPYTVELEGPAGFTQDCDGDGIPNECEIGWADCNANDIPDDCEIAVVDCNSNSIPDDCDLRSASSLDCNTNAIPDACDVSAADCNTNGIPDTCDLATGASADCNTNGINDECDTDCDDNGRVDACDIFAGNVPDCNTNNVPDSCDENSPTWTDCNGNHVLDACDNVNFIRLGSPTYSPLAVGTNHEFVLNAPPPSLTDIILDFQAQGRLGGTFANVAVSIDGNVVGAAYLAPGRNCFYPYDTDRLVVSAGQFNDWIADGVARIRMTPSNAVTNTCIESWIRVTVQYTGAGASADCNHDSVPDDCQSGDCNGNSQPDILEICAGGADCNSDGVLDACQIEDCDSDGIADVLAFCQGAVEDCDSNGLPDVCDVAAGPQFDCDGNLVVDACESLDCDDDGTLDLREICAGSGSDCNANAVLDACEILTRSAALRFDGVNDFAQVPHSPSLTFGANDTFTIEVWIGGITAVNGTEATVVEKGSTSGPYPYSIRIRSDGRMLFLANRQAFDGRIETIVGTTVVTDGRWHHIAGVRSGRDWMRLYVDGRLEGEIRGIPEQSISNTAVVTLGARVDQSAHLRGSIDDVRLWRIIRTPQQVLATMFTPLTGAEPGLAAYWRLDEGVGQVIQDASPGAHNGIRGENANAAGEQPDPRWVTVVAPLITQDCNLNGIPDDCDIAGGLVPDCNSNGVPDGCEPECNQNGIPDSCDIASGASRDCNSNAIPDDCDPDCNANHTPDDCDVARGTSLDVDTNGIPDECGDCNSNGIADRLDVAQGTSPDCNGNAIPDDCDIRRGTLADCNSNRLPDLCEPLPPQGVIYVDGSAPTGGDGSTWNTAFSGLSSALCYAKSRPGRIAQIRVAAGRYVPTDNPNDRLASFGLIAGVTITGGYAGRQSATPDENNPDSHATILSADLLGNDSPNFGNNAENVYHVVTALNVDETAVLEGCTITGGNANGASTSTNRGGGVYMDNASPTIRRCVVRSNVGSAAAGGVSMYIGHPHIESCSFYSNNAAGGGAVLVDSAEPEFTQCRFESNRSTAHHGGAIRNNNAAAPRLDRCIFIANIASGEGGALYSGGGTPIADCLFLRNSAGGGGAIYGAGLVVNSLFSGNSAGRGGAIYDRDGQPRIINSTFVGNVSSGNGGTSGGGAIHSLSGDLTLLNCILWQNADDGGMDETGQVQITSGEVISVDYCCIQGWTSAILGKGNLSTDPGLADVNGADNQFGTEDDDVHLLSDSPCANAGLGDAPDVPSTDFEGNPRVQHCRIDVGADESPEFSDCDADSVADSCEIAQDGTLDCDGNRLLDACEAPSADCNQNGMKDICDAYLLDRTSGQLMPFDRSHPQSFTLSAAPMTAVDVTLTFLGRANITGIGHPDVYLGNIPLGQIFTTGSASCGLYSTQLVIPWGTWNGAISEGGGDAVIRAIPQPTMGEDCGPGTFVKITVAYAVNDCNHDGIPDDCNIAAGVSDDCNLNGFPDECEEDCNSNDIPDDCDLAAATSVDCNANDLLDECDLAFPLRSQDLCADAELITANVIYAGDTTSAGLDGSSSCGNPTRDLWYKYIPLTSGTLTIAAVQSQGDRSFSLHSSCPGNLDNQFACAFTQLVYNVAAGTPYWIRVDGQYGSYQMRLTGPVGIQADCNGNGVPDECELDNNDFNGNGVPDPCEDNADCNSNGVQDILDTSGGASRDCNRNAIPDECELAAGTLSDCDSNGTADACGPDCNENGVADSCDLIGATSADCNTNNVPDECDIIVRLQFSDRDAYPTGVHPFDIESADFNRDGSPDLVIPNGDNTTFSILLNRGLDAGGRWLNFANAVNYTTIGTPVAAALGDYDQDGDVDAAVQSSQTGSVGVHLNNGDGTFASLQTFAGVSGFDAAAGDLNGDGYPDLVLAGNSSTAVILFNNRQAAGGQWLGFAPPTQIVRVGRPQRAVLADMDGDHDLDILIPTRVPHTLVVYLNTGNGTLATPTAYLAGQNPTSVAVGDLNSDGLPDAIVTNEVGGTLTALFNQGRNQSGIWLGLGEQAEYSFGQSPASIAIAKIDADCVPDVLIGNSIHADVRVSINRGIGELQPPFGLAVSEGAKAVLALDVNGDERNDLVVAVFGRDRAEVYLNETVAPESQDINGNGLPDECEAGDYNGDGVVDQADVQYFLDSLLRSPCLEIGDFNGDGVIDGTDIEIFIELMMGG